MVLWKQVVSNKLLANVNIILFLNKCDLLKVRRLVRLNGAFFPYTPIGKARERRADSKFYSRLLATN